MQTKDGKIFIFMFKQIFMGNHRYKINNCKTLIIIILKLLTKTVKYKIHLFKDHLQSNEK